jgi:hypothetical protein
VRSATWILAVNDAGVATIGPPAVAGWLPWATDFDKDIFVILNAGSIEDIALSAE